MTEQNLEEPKDKYWVGEGKTIVVLHYCKVKSPVTNVFLNGVAYKVANSNDPEIYVRAMSDFIFKFKPLLGEEE